MWAKLDEVLGAVMLTVIAGTSMYLNVGHSVVEMCVTGIVALLAVQSAKKKE